MLELEEARERILASIQLLPDESVPAATAAGRVLAESLDAPISLPCFDNSAMDGYAVRADDLKGASAGRPVSLSLRGESAAGKHAANPVEPGTSVRIFTGGPLPVGADAVVMQEDARPGPAKDVILFSEAVKPWENVRLCGEDVKRGAPLLSAGEVLNVGGVGLLSALGLKTIRVRRQPIIGLLATGNELIEPGEPLAPGKIYESNRATLAALLPRAGAAAKVFPLVADNLEATQTGLKNALAECDGAITTGGVSVGEHDFVKKAFTDLGGVLDFWKVSVRPGKPFVFGRWGDKFLFGLPGNPVSALVTFLLLVRPALLKWQGAANLELPASPGLLAEPLVNRADRRHFMRVSLDQTGNVWSAGVQASHILSSLARANGLVDVPPQTTLKAGAAVQVLRWE